METTKAPALPGPQLVTGPAPTLLELQGIRKVFLTDEVETHALSDVHLAVKKGEWLAIVGPSGSGKTTLLALLADEPTGNLDSKNGQAVMKLLRELHQSGSTLIMVTHDPAYARLASRTVTLFDGRIVDESSSPGGETAISPSA